MDFIGSCEGRWQRNKVAQPKDGGAGFDTRTHHRVDGSNGNGEMRKLHQPSDNGLDQPVSQSESLLL